MAAPLYLLGGWQSDFSEASTGGLYPLLEAAVHGALESSDLAASEIEVVHIGNTGGELFSGQGHLGGMVASVDPAFAGLPTGRHEAACASGSLAVLGAMADVESGRYDVALVVGVEILRNVPGRRAADLLRASMWSDREEVDEPLPWPSQFGTVAEQYDRRYGIDPRHLSRISEINLANARRNPNAQTRHWDIADDWFEIDEQLNPVVCGLLRRSDCGRITDGSAAIVIASEDYAREYSSKRSRAVSSLSRIKGWGHRTAPMLLSNKIEQAAGSPYLFPQVRSTALDAVKRAGLKSVEELDVVELHDCFSISEYVLLDHFGLTEPGKIWQLIEDGVIEPKGRLPVNPSGGLLGGGHPVGATGVRMLLDASKQVTDAAGDYQVDGARNAMTFNVGGSFTTIASFIVGVD